MKKGFTLVELAIVLVVIGLIMGMAIKGKSLIEVAKVRSEMAKLSKIEAAMAMYVARSGGRLPAISVDGVIGADNLTGSNLITQKDLTSDIGGKDYILYRCIGTTDNASKGLKALTESTIKQTPGTDVCAVMTGMPATLACNVEVILDNKDALTGGGRLWTDKAADIATDPFKDGSKDYTQCPLLEGAGAKDYAYIVF